MKRLVATAAFIIASQILPVNAQAVPTLQTPNCVANWAAPTSNVDGSPLTAVLHYNVYTRTGAGVYPVTPTAMVNPGAGGAGTWACAPWATTLPTMPLHAWAFVTAVTVAGEGTKVLCGPNPPSNACATEFEVNLIAPTAVLPGSVVNPHFGP